MKTDDGMEYEQWEIKAGPKPKTEWTCVAEEPTGEWIEVTEEDGRKGSAMLYPSGDVAIQVSADVIENITKALSGKSC